MENPKIFWTNSSRYRQVLFCWKLTLILLTEDEKLSLTRNRLLLRYGWKYKQASAFVTIFLRKWKRNDWQFFCETNSNHWSKQHEIAQWNEQFADHDRSWFLQSLLTITNTSSVIIITWQAWKWWTTVWLAGVAVSLCWKERTGILCVLAYRRVDDIYGWNLSMFCFVTFLVVCQWTLARVAWYTDDSTI